MGFAAVDYAIVAVYLAGVTLAGIWIAGRQFERTKDSRIFL